jgi:hypothetical protein
MEQKCDEPRQNLENPREQPTSYPCFWRPAVGSLRIVCPWGNTEMSDLDFLVEFEKKSFDAYFDAYMDLKAFLEKLFGCRVDLVLENAIKPRLRSTILNEALHAEGL